MLIHPGYPKGNQVFLCGKEVESRGYEPDDNEEQHDVYDDACLAVLGGGVADVAPIDNAPTSQEERCKGSQ